MIGNSLTHYRITAKLGEGGMGEVYRATDTKLGREVAIKVLPASFSRDPQSLARFEREAKALASLNHPHIAAIHGFDADQGTHFLVLELVEGQTLAERLRRGRLPVEEALRVARQIAEAVETAHAKGIIHRDLKPGNIKLTPEGRVKVLDFGLAKLQAPVAAGGQTVDMDAATQFQSAAETTTPGAVMGTPAYMSPEQARGQEVDKRTDVWAFGCCLFECLAGRKPFRGETVTDLMSEVLKSEPDWSALPAEVTREVATLLRRCLEKDPRRRLSSLGDIALLLEDSTQSRQPDPITSTATETRRLLESTKRPSLVLRMSPWIAVLVLGIALGFSVMRRAAAPAERASQIRSLAVLPFTFETQDPKLAGLGKWIPAEIRSKLGPLQNLQVVNSPARIEQLVQQKKSEVEIARELGVDGLVMGELHGQGETMSAYVWVVDGSTGRALGRQRVIASSAAKLSELPNQVALAIVDELKLQVSTSQRTEIQVADTQNAEAFLAYQKGLELLNSRQFSQAAVELRRAYQLDTNYTRAWAALAESEWVPLIYGGMTNEIATTYQRLSREAERFRAQRPDDPALASLRMWIAMIFERDWNKVSAVFWDIQRNLKPNAEVLAAMSWYYTMIEGHPEPALQSIQKAFGLDPENLMHQIDRGHQLVSFGRYDDAVRAFRSLPPEKIQFEDYSHVLLIAGDLAGAKEVATRVLAGRPNALTQCQLAGIHAKSGAGDEARKILVELEAQAEKGMHIPYGKIAWSYGMLGDFDAARRWLRRGLLEGHGDWTMLELRCAEKLEPFGKFAWYWEIIDEMKFPPLQMDNPYFALEQAMRYGRGSVGAPTTSTSTNEPPKTLAVLPFANTSADKTDDSFSDGVTEELITTLQKIQGLRVQGRMSSFFFKGKNETPQRVGEQLKVEHLLHGSVSRAGSRLRISADLVTAASGFSLWSTNYDRELSDIFAIRTEVAQQVAQALRVQLGMEETRSLAQKKPTENLEAYQMYLQGRQLWNRRTPESLQQAVKCFEEAIGKDPGYALAYAGLADCYVILPEYAGMTSGEAMPKARVAAMKALELDGSLAEPHAALAFVKGQFYWDWPGAEVDFRQAIATNPHDATAHHWFSVTVLGPQGRFDEALAEMQRAQELDPLSPIINVNVGEQLNYVGKTDLGIQVLQKQIADAPSFLMARATLGAVYYSADRLPEAVAELESMHRLDGSGTFQLDYLGFVYARAGRTTDAQKILVQLQELQRQGLDQRVGIALVQHGLGDDEGAAASLELALEEKSTLLRTVNSDSFWKDFRPHPRVQAILKRINLVK